MIRDRPVFSVAHENVSDFVPPSSCLYVYGRSIEKRSGHVDEWKGNVNGVEFVAIEKEERSSFEVEGGERIPLRNRKLLTEFLERAGERPLYLDITGLSHHVWAPLVRAGLGLRMTFVVVYVEPGEYRFNPAPTEGEIFDLSERIEGIAPLPGFALLADTAEEDVCFVPVLGFEGARFAFVTESVQPPGQKIVPVIGIPGFRAEYPFYAYAANRRTLLSTHSWRNVRYASANCPFSVFYQLEDIAEDYPGHILKIAPIGTKPHALGCVLYAIKSRRGVEIVYDYPIRKAKRTSGTARLLEYFVSAFTQG